ncbi:MAG TPA: hypothetical protein VN222_09460 [Novosphingobium sp.]|nr:hypothetical protein [Novosphingobium sp.]
MAFRKTPALRLALRLSGVFAAGAAMLAVAAPAQAQALRKVYVRNACKRPVQLLVDSADAYHSWHPHAWYRFAPAQESYLNDPQGRPLRQLEDHELYAYIETTDAAEPLRWQGGGPEVTWEGAAFRTVRLNSRIDADGDMLVRITCD